jgi:hypothetical protein
LANRRHPTKPRRQVRDRKWIDPIPIEAKHEKTPPLSWRAIVRGIQNDRSDDIPLTPERVQSLIQNAAIARVRQAPDILHKEERRVQNRDDAKKVVNQITSRVVGVLTANFAKPLTGRTAHDPIYPFRKKLTKNSTIQGGDVRQKQARVREVMFE